MSFIQYYYYNVIATRQLIIVNQYSRTIHKFSKYYYKIEIYYQTYLTKIYYYTPTKP